MMRILFVCTGNLCRSPLAAGYLKKLLHEKDVSGIEISSAGLWAIDGNTPEETASKVAEENEIDLSNHCSKLLKAEDIKEADLILVMERLQFEEMVRIYPDVERKVKLLRRFARDGTIKFDIIDAYGMPLDNYRECFEEIKESVDGLFKFLTVHGMI